jgi:hypothetical protein
MRRAAALAFLVLVPVILAHADVPVRTEQVIYAVVAYNGKDYTPTFAPESSDTIYLLADSDNFLSVRKTFVYWWPPTGRWQTEASTFNELQPGILEVTGGGGAPRLLEMEKYTYFNVSGEYEQNWKVAVGEAADAEYKHSQEISQRFVEVAAEYSKRHADYLSQLRALSSRIEMLKALKKDHSAVKEQMDTLPAPPEPQQPRDYIVPPTPVQGAFIVNLPPGRYRVRLLNQEAQVLEGSERLIVSHSARRTKGVGYEVLPSDKWTRPEESRAPSAVLYVNGKADLYVTPFFENEYNDLDFGRTTDNAAPGNPAIFSWTRIQQVPHAVLALRSTGPSAVSLREQPFLVQQTEGAGLGYTIVPFNGEGDQQGKEANLRAFHLSIKSGPKSFALQALDEHGTLLPGSERRIRIVEPARGTVIFILIVLVPLIVMVWILFARGFLYSGGREEARAGRGREHPDTRE